MVPALAELGAARETWVGRRSSLRGHTVIRFPNKATSVALAEEHRAESPHANVAEPDVSLLSPVAKAASLDGGYQDTIMLCPHLNTAEARSQSGC